MLLDRFKKALLLIEQDRAEYLQHDKNLQPTYVIAFSGGLDSCVLLHLCVQSGMSCRAIYVHHGLQSEADEWESFCERICKDLRVKFSSIRIDAKPKRRQSPEEAAREARYAALKQQIRPDEVLLTAHHANDQAETVLLQLMRGAGTAGLSAMPRTQRFEKGFHSRPLLDIKRESLVSFAEKNDIDWVEDKSNQDESYDRNFIRQQVLPMLNKRWEQAVFSLSTVAEKQQSNLALNDALATIDLAGVVSDPESRTLSIKRLKQLDRDRQLNSLRYWILDSGLDKPSSNVLNEIVDSILLAADDAEPLVHWSNTEVRRFQDALYIMQKLPEHDVTSIYVLKADSPVTIHSIGRTVDIERVQKEGIDECYLQSDLELRFRQGGETIRLTGRQHTSKLKQLLQDNAIPTWERDRIPLLYIDGELASICGYGVADKFASRDQSGWLPVVHPS